MRRALLLLLLVACTDPTTPPDDGDDAAKHPPGDEPVPQQQTYSAKGLYTFPNPLSEVPDGAFSRADDVVIRRDGIAETRRGFKTATGTFGSSGDRLTALSDFAGTLVGQTDANALLRYNGSSAWTAYSGSYTRPAPQRMRFLLMGKALYFTTNGGVQRLDTVTGTPMDAGVPQAIDGTATVTGSSGFLPVNSQTAYRFVWGYRTANDRIILGAPSGRVTVTNPAAASTSVNVALTVRIPEWVTTDYFIQVYRADTSATAAIPASDDMALAYEKYPTASEVSARTLSFTDITPDALKGAALYSSPNAGVPGSEKFQPPVCADIAEYKERMWCAATVQRQRVTLTLLSVDSSSGGLSVGDGLQFANLTDTFAVYGDTTSSPGRFVVETSGTAAQNIAATAKNLVQTVNDYTGNTFLTAYYISGEYDSPGQILFELRDLGATPFEVVAFNAGPYWAPALKSGFTASSLSRTGSTVTVTTTLAHHISVGQQVSLSTNTANFPSGVKTVAAVPTTTTFTYTEAGATATYGSVTFWDTLDPALDSDPTDAPNGLAYSEYGEPDAVPLPNYLSAGSANYRILRLVTLGDTLFLFKEEGIWILTGDSPETFSRREFPTPAKLLAPDSLVVLGNSIYALTDQGVMVITESGAQVISRPIEGDLLPLYSGNATMLATLKSVAFGVAYETEREYHLFLPSTSSDTYATQEYVYNYATGAWTRWTKAATCGYVLPGSDLEYLGKATANAALVERKGRTVTDYQDEDGVAITSAVDWQVRTGGDPSAYKQWQKATVMLDATGPTSVTLSVDTEISASAASGSFTLDGLPYVSTYIPVEQSRSQVLTVGVSGGQAQKRLALTGLSVDFIPSSTKLR